MATRIPLLRPRLLRCLVHSHLSVASLSSQIRSSLLPKDSPEPLFPFLPRFSGPLRPFSSFCRPFSSSAGSSSIVLIGSEQGFNDSLKKVRDEGLDAIFYFTAVWCGPCKFISPVIEEMSRTFPKVVVYKVDIDLDGLSSTLEQLRIYSVPTLHFFQTGKKTTEIVGADAARLKHTMETLYKP